MTIEPTGGCVDWLVDHLPKWIWLFVPLFLYRPIRDRYRKASQLGRPNG